MRGERRAEGVSRSQPRAPSPEAERGRTPRRLFCSPFPVPPPHTPKEFVGVGGRERKEAPSSEPERTQPAGWPSLARCVCSLGSRQGSGVPTPHRRGADSQIPRSWRVKLPFLAFHPSLQMLALPLEPRVVLGGISEGPAGFPRFFRHVPLILRSGRVRWAPSCRLTEGLATPGIRLEIPSQGRRRRKGWRGGETHLLECSKSCENRLLESNVTSFLYPSPIIVPGTSIRVESLTRTLVTRVDRREDSWS